MRWRSAAVTAAWAALATVAGGLGAWTLAGFDGAAGDRSRPLDDAAVRRALAAGQGPSAPASTRDPDTAGPTRKPTASPTPGTASPTPAPTPTRHSTLRFTGGTATAECRPDGTVYLVSWSPADGYHVEEYARGPAPMARLELEPSAEDADDIAYRISCGGSGKATAVRAPDDDD
ncbi:hypothetical protein ACFQVC_16035 [Streptomyces monticola]|uniref:Serine/threonine protein kinase n=1 Tax=Streptomyces monticola TaxID=2666263 RepID=A0ABW2JK28_9ACTN